VSVMMNRLRPLTFLAASYPRVLAWDGVGALDALGVDDSGGRLVSASLGGARPPT
jgi:hypothetical protein